MRKATSLFLVIVIACLSFSACGEGFTKSFPVTYLASQDQLTAEQWISDKNNALTFAALSMIDSLVYLLSNGNASESDTLQQIVTEALDQDINDSNNLHIAILQTGDEVSLYCFGINDNIQIKYNTKTKMLVYTRNQMPLSLAYYQQYRLIKLPAQETQSKYLEMLAFLMSAAQ